jgi:hypothetical protein
MTTRQAMPEKKQKKSNSIWNVCFGGLPIGRSPLDVLIDVPIDAPRPLFAHAAGARSTLFSGKSHELPTVDLLGHHSPLLE